MFFVYLMNTVFDYFDVHSLIGWAMSLVKNIRIAIALLMPTKRGSIEYLRGGRVRIKYTENDGSERYILMNHQFTSLKWDRVTCVTKQIYESMLAQELEEKQKLADRNEEKKISEQVDDIQNVTSKWTSTSEPSQTTDTEEPENPQENDEEKRSVEKSERKMMLARVKRCDTLGLSEDVTDKILKFAGPAKDFFGLDYTMKDISRELNCDAMALIFHFRDGKKTFLQHQRVYLYYLRD